MNHKREIRIEDLRRRLTDTQQAILNEIWKYWREEKKIITAVALYNKFGKERVESALSGLGGSIVFRSGDAGRKFYQLTFLGKLLCSEGKEAQQLLEQYLEHIKDRLALEPELGVVNRDDFENRLGFSQEQFALFTEVLFSSPLWEGGNQTTGTISVPKEVDDLAASQSANQFLEDRALRDYDPDKPLDYNFGQANAYVTADRKEETRTQGLSKSKISILLVGSYVLYFLYIMSSEAARRGGLFAFQYRSTWWIALGQTVWLLIAVLAALLVVIVLGPEHFLGIFPPARRLLLLEPIDAEATETVLADGRAEADDSQSSFSEETGLGFQLYLDYNESIKKVYNNAILQYRNSFYFSLIFATVGFGVIFYTLVFRNNGNTSWPAVVVSAVIEAVPALFFYLSDKARKQMIDVFVDLRQDNEIARAYELLRTLKHPEQLEQLKAEIIRHTLLANERKIR